MSLINNLHNRRGDKIQKSEGSHPYIYRPRQGRADGCWGWGKSFMLSGVSSATAWSCWGKSSKRVSVRAALEAASNREISLPHSLRRSSTHEKHLGQNMNKDVPEQRRPLTGRARRRADADPIARNPARILDLPACPAPWPLLFGPWGTAAASEAGPVDTSISVLYRHTHG